MYESGLHSSQEYYTRKRGLVVPHVRLEASLEVERNFFLSAPLCRTPENALRGEPASYIYAPRPA